MKKDTTSFSIIVPAYNEEENISKCLESLLELDYRSVEIMVVDDGSSDDTAEIANRYQDRGVKVVRMYRNEGRAAALNAGIRESNGDIILFVDADATADPDLLKKVKCYFEMGYYAVGGNVKTANLNSTIACANGLLYFVFNTTLRRILAPNRLSGACMAIKQSVLRELGGFSERAWWFEDSDLSARFASKKKAIFASDIFVRIMQPETIYTSWKQKYRYGVAAGLRVRKKEPYDFRIFLRPLYFLFVVLALVFSMIFIFNIYMWTFFLGVLLGPTCIVITLSLFVVYKHKEYKYLKAMPIVGLQFLLRECGYSMGFIFGLLSFYNHRQAQK